MRRTDEDFKAEVFRRCEAYHARQKKRRRMVVAVCLPLLLCSAALMAVFSGGFGMNVSFDKTASAECMDAPAAVEMPEAEEALEDSVSAANGTAREPDELQLPEDFAIRFVWSIMAENIYDTYTGQIQKDLVLDGVATAAFEPDQAVLEEIYRKILELDIVTIDREMTSAVLTTTDEVLMCLPLETYQIQFTMNGQTYVIEGDYSADSYPEDDQAVRFMEFVRFMLEIAWNTPEYQSLPDANGGYD